VAAAGSDIPEYTSRLTRANVIFAQASRKASDFTRFDPAGFGALLGLPATAMAKN
jgi:hypothetical protein